MAGGQPPTVELAPLPLLAARGAHDGPTLFLTGAVHGDEYEGPAAIHHIFNTLDLSRLHGRVIGLPVVNLAAYRARSRISPVDGIDLNRTFPGADQPSQSYRLAQTIFTTFVESCDILVDLHSGGAKLIHLPMVGWYAGDARAERIARTFSSHGTPLADSRSGTGCSPVKRTVPAKSRSAPNGAAGRGWTTLVWPPIPLAITQLLATFADPVEAVSQLDQRPPIAGTYQEAAVGGLFVATATLGDSCSNVAPRWVPSTMSWASQWR